jgi:hypothetical protein
MKYVTDLHSLNVGDYIMEYDYTCDYIGFGRATDDIKLYDCLLFTTLESFRDGDGMRVEDHPDINHRLTDLGEDVYLLTEQEFAEHVIIHSL